ncbi:hypothetical protein PSUM_26190 [Pseudomonas umsongensis]|uniref:Uncharacterized protein n=1 Tax=Pseudomonas umsongensis TaxID=198618 RepID=A0ABX4DNY6_9PSED|nr:hypothetical protein PSUM_26190 [Pseudomonas umsongensis]
MNCRSEHAPGGVPTKNLRAPRGARLPALSLTSIASKLAPTVDRVHLRAQWSPPPTIQRHQQQSNHHKPHQ